MKLLIIGNFELDRQESMQRFGKLLVEGMRRRGHTVAFVTPRPVLANLLGSYQYSGRSKYLGYIDKFILFPGQLRKLIAKEKPDVVHIADHANAIYATSVSGSAVVCTCHDLLQIRAALGELPEQRVGRFGRLYQKWILRAISRLPHVACVSTKTLQDLLRLTRMNSDKAVCILNGLNFPYRPRSRSDAAMMVQACFSNCRLTPEVMEKSGFLLSVGGDQWYKNRNGLIAIYAHLRALLPSPPLLLIVGKRLSSEQIEMVGDLGIASYVQQVENVDNGQLEALYATAKALLFPSLEEGFGWPIAEAQACGCPVFTSQRSPMTEVGGEAAVYFNPTNPKEAAHRIALAWDTLEEMRKAGLKHAAKWSQERMLGDYEVFYRNSMNQKAG